MKRFAAAFVSVLFLGAAAAADEAPPVTDWTTNEVVVVDASAQGPAMWHLQKGDSEIWFLGTVGLMPKDLAWNTMRLEQTIDGANAMWLPPEANADLLDVFDLSWFFLTHRGVLSMPGDQTLEESLPPELRARFVAARERLGKKASEYEDDSPLLAGFKLLGAFVDVRKMTAELPRKAAQKIARDKHVKVRRIAEYNATPLIKEMFKLPREAGRVCLVNGLTQVEILEKHAVAAADAWAVGDVAGIKANYSTALFRDCVMQTKRFGELNQRAVDDTVKTVHEALARPGKTVMLIDVGWLFRAGGVADRLAAEGLVLEGSAD